MQLPVLISHVSVYIFCLNLICINSAVVFELNLYRGLIIIMMSVYRVMWYMQIMLNTCPALNNLLLFYNESYDNNYYCRVTICDK